MTVDYRLIGQRIKDARKECQMTQEILAEQLNVSVGYVSQVERGATKISLDLLGTLSSILDKDLAYFVQNASTGNDRYLIPEIAELLLPLSPADRRVLAAAARAMQENRQEAKG